MNNAHCISVYGVKSRVLSDELIVSKPCIAYRVTVDENRLATPYGNPVSVSRVFEKDGVKVAACRDLLTLQTTETPISQLARVPMPDEETVNIMALCLIAHAVNPQLAAAAIVTNN